MTLYVNPNVVRTDSSPEELLRQRREKKHERRLRTGARISGQFPDARGGIIPLIPRELPLAQ